MTGRCQTTEFGGDGVTLVGDHWTPPCGEPTLGTVLLLHGGGQTRHSWRTTGSRLADQGWSALALDARGHGDSEWAPDGDYTHDALSADLRAVISTLSGPPVLVGASMGGMTSMIVEGEHRGTARALVLVDIAPKVEKEGAAAIFEFMSSGLQGFDSLADAASAIAAYNPNRTSKPTEAGLRKNLRERDGKWFWHWDPAFLNQGDEPTRSRSDSGSRYERARAAAAAITCPTLLIRGKQSNVVSEAGANELLTLIPSAHLIDVSDAGHMVAGDDNDVFTSGLTKFLAELR